MSEPKQEKRCYPRVCVAQTNAGFDTDSWYDDGQGCPSYGIAVYRWGDAAPLAVHDSPQPRANHSHVKQEVTDITILHDVRLAFHSQLRAVREISVVFCSAKAALLSRSERRLSDSNLSSGP